MNFESFDQDNRACCLLEAELPLRLKNDACCMGIDEAGRGPVLGVGMK